MLGFGIIFVTPSVAFALVAQGFYKPQPLFDKTRFVDEILGGLLGIIEFGHHPGRRRSSSSTRYFAVPGNPTSAPSCRSSATSFKALDTSPDRRCSTATP